MPISSSVKPHRHRLHVLWDIGMWLEKGVRRSCPSPSAAKGAATP